MKSEQTIADMELKSKDRSIKVKALVDTGASKSVISKELAYKIGEFFVLKESYELRLADEKGKLKIIGNACLT